MKVERLAESDWIHALDSLPCYPFFVTPRFLNAWARHYASKATPRAWRVSAPSGSWRLAAMVELRTSRFGTTALIGTPEGGYCTAGKGPMPGDWIGHLLRALRNPLMDNIELVLGPDDTTSISPERWSVVTEQKTWIVDLTAGVKAWLDESLDKRVRRQLRICDTEGVRTTRHGLEALDEFYDLYERALQESSARRLSYSKRFIGDLMVGEGPGEALIYLTRQNTRLIAGGLLLRGGTHGLAWIGAFDRAMAHLHGNLHRHYTVICDLVDARARCYNLGASPGLPDVARFKQKLGATPRSYQAISWRNPLVARMRELVGRGR